MCCYGLVHCVLVFLCSVSFLFKMCITNWKCIRIKHFTMTYFDLTLHHCLFEPVRLSTQAFIHILLRWGRESRCLWWNERRTKKRKERFSNHISWVGFPAAEWDGEMSRPSQVALFPVASTLCPAHSLTRSLMVLCCSFHTGCVCVCVWMSFYQRRERGSPR